jgi:hypothetical protein
MNLQILCEQYAAFRKTLGERFEVNERQLKAFCRTVGPNLDINDVSLETVTIFLVGKGSLTTSWYVRENALRGFYRYATVAGLLRRRLYRSPFRNGHQHSNLISIRLLNCGACWIRQNRAADLAVILTPL